MKKQTNISVLKELVNNNVMERVELYTSGVQAYDIAEGEEYNVIVAYEKQGGRYYFIDRDGRRFLASRYYRAEFVAGEMLEVIANDRAAAQNAADQVEKHGSVLMRANLLPLFFEECDRRNISVTSTATGFDNFGRMFTKYDLVKDEPAQQDDDNNNDAQSNESNEGNQTPAGASRPNITRRHKTITQKTYRIMKTNKNNTVTKLKYVGVDDWGYNKYKGKNGRIYVDVANSKDPRFPANLHTVTRDWGEPCEPVHFDNIKVTGWTDEDQAQKVFQFEYMMLSALQMKVSSYKSWGYTKEGIIKEMRHYYDLLPVKPEWCTKEDIDNYERNIF